MRYALLQVMMAQQQTLAQLLDLVNQCQQHLQDVRHSLMSGAHPGSSVFPTEEDVRARTYRHERESLLVSFRDAALQHMQGFGVLPHSPSTVKGPTLDSSYKAARSPPKPVFHPAPWRSARAHVPNRTGQHVPAVPLHGSETAASPSTTRSWLQAHVAPTNQLSPPGKNDATSSVRSKSADATSALQRRRHYASMSLQSSISNKVRACKDICVYLQFD